MIGGNVKWQHKFFKVDITIGKEIIGITADVMLLKNE